MSNLPRLLRSLAAEPLAIERRTFDAFHAVVRRKGIEGVAFDGGELHAELEVASPRSQRTQSADLSVRVIPVVGTIMNRAYSMGIGAVEVGRMVDAAAADPRVDAIVLDIDSPGGTVTGVPELAAKVFAARSEKPVVAVANGLMASAAYWIGSAADTVVASPSSEVGSIGVFSVHEDWSKWLEEEGVVVTEIAAGKYKTEGAPWKPLDDEAMTFLSDRVAEVYQWFTKDVAMFRGDMSANVRSGYGEGRALGAKQAKDANLVDRIATLDETIAKLASGSGRRGSRARAANARTAARLTSSRR